MITLLAMKHMHGVHVACLGVRKCVDDYNYYVHGLMGVCEYV